MLTTIGEVAKRAGVSKATVSRVLNNSKPVRSETRVRVERAIADLDFKPNPAARTLIKKKSKTIGVVVTDSANLFVAVLVRGIESVALESGYNIFICNSHESPVKEVELLQMLRDKRVDGIIFLTSRLDQSHRQFFKSNPAPVSLINVDCSEHDLISIRIDNRRAAYDMTSHFTRAGHSRIAMIRASMQDEYTGRDRFLGYREALEDAGIAYDPDLVRTGNLEPADGYLLVSELLREKHDFSALFVVCDLMAFGAIKALLDHGLRIPGDVEVAGFDDVPMASYYHPSLSTVQQPIEKMGKLAARELIRQIEAEVCERRDFILPHRIVLRDSTGRESRPAGAT